MSESDVVGAESGAEIREFYASLPAKRMAAGLVCRDADGRVLLVRPTYKSTWHVPGGVVDLDESPVAAAEREAQEELGLGLAVGRLLVVDWLPPRPPKTEGLMFLFDGGILDDDLITRIRLPPDELAEMAFVEATSIRDRVTPSLAARVEAGMESLASGVTRYLEAGEALAHEPFDHENEREASQHVPDLELADGDVVLRRWELDDAAAVHAACQDSLIQRFIPIPRPYTEEIARSWVERARGFWGDNPERAFAIVDGRSGRLLGSVTRHGPYGHRATFGYWLAPEARGRGAATRALRLITDWTLQTTDAVRLDLYTMVDNEASMRVAERAGYEREAVLRAWDVDGDGRPVDVVYYALIRRRGAA